MPVIVITGASHGIGAAVAGAFATHPNARLALVARTEAKLVAVAEHCRARGAEAVVLPADVTDDDAVSRMAAAVLDRWGAPDVLVNNAGIFLPGALTETTPADFRTQLDANLTSAFLVTHAFLGPMMERRQGHLFFMGSVASIRAYPGSVAYCAAKHGLLGLARVVREETRAQGLRVTTLLPGATFTPSWEGTEWPEQRFMPADDIAAAVLTAWHMTGRSVVEEILIRPQEGDLP